MNKKYLFAFSGAAVLIVAGIIAAPPSNKANKITVASSTASSAPATIKAKATKQDYDNALNKTRSSKGKEEKADSNGILKRMASIGSNVAWEEIDSMRAVSFYTPLPEIQIGMQTTFNAKHDHEASLYVYISRQAYKKPVFRLVPQFNGSKWLFLENLKITDNNELLFDQNYLNKDITRENDSYGVVEYADKPVSDDDLKMLRKLAASKDLRVRLSGKSNYIAMEPKQIERMQKSVASLLQFYDALSSVLPEVEPES